MGPRFVNTTKKGLRPSETRERERYFLSIAYHPDLSRIGERHTLASGEQELSRLTPEFGPSVSSERAPLDDPFISRRALFIRATKEGLELRNPESLPVLVEGKLIDVRFKAPIPQNGLTIELGDRVVLLLQKHGATTQATEAMGLIGDSDALSQIRERIASIARGPNHPVLIHGETGVGKELIARALHDQSPRAARPFIAVNMAAIPAPTAASELFGHEKGAFTGADGSRSGYFGAAEGGTLFLDEIGETPSEIQPMLLRALESGEVQPVGGEAKKRGVAIITATDADLEAAVAQGNLRPALLHRLCSAKIEVPPLRERREDIGPLLRHFVEEERALRDQTKPLDQTLDERLWLPASLAARLVRSDWPGNVRQLKNTVRRLVALGVDKPQIPDDGTVAKAEASPTSQGPIDEDQLLTTLRAHRFQLNRAAKALGISRSGLDALIEKSGRIQKAKDLRRDQIEAAQSACDGDVDKMAERLEVSVRGLKLRMTQLGL